MSARAGADLVVLRLDLPGLRGTGLVEVALVVGGLVVLLLLGGLLGLDGVPLYLDDLGGVRRVPHVAVELVHHREPDRRALGQIRDREQRVILVVLDVGAQAAERACVIVRAERRIVVVAQDQT